ncbi:hypothetical protein C5167_029272 [Papaver somniferum]|nr:hypothetical protein C5167_029272 [Papaver somniferum]
MQHHLWRSETITSSLQNQPIANSTYQTNLSLLLSSLSKTFTNRNTIPLYGYRNITVGENPDTVYGSLHCREDIAPEICSACVQRAAEEVGKDSMHPNSKRAIMYYNGCVLRYSNRYYFSIMQENPAVPLNNQNNVTDPASCLTLVTGLLDGLVIEAVNNTSSSPSLFSTGTANYTRENTVYGMRGAQVLYPSCTFRYEIYPFYGQSVYATTQALAPAHVVLPPTQQPLSNTTTFKYSNTFSCLAQDNSNSLRLSVGISVPLGIAVLLSSIAVWWFYFHKKKKINAQDGKKDFRTVESLHFKFDIISTATDNFSEANKLGEGGFGSVYKGTLSDGQEIAVKRLSEDSGQGDQEFKNEVLLLAKLEHKNLVRLLGFCLHGQEKLLIYELMNASLDQFIFDTLKQTYLDWEMRYKIIGGIARGLLYLHEDSRLKIIHRDLKTSNILLAPDMTPKIADFVGENPDTVYGSLHCREDVAPAICSACVQRAAEEVGKDSMCPNSKKAIMYYNGCVLRYSDKYYFTIMQEKPAVPLNNQNNVSNPASYLTLVTGLLDGLVIEAVTNTSSSPSLFSTGTANYTRENTVYGMVQCTPDLTPSTCATCVRSAMKLIPRYFYGKRGARVLSPSCTFIYEIYPFYGQSIYATTQALPPAPVMLPPTLQPIAVSISIPLGIAVLLSSIAIWWFYFHKKKKINDWKNDFQTVESLHFKFDIISTATDNFSEANKLGEGGFGPVYKGTMSDGQEIAVKRLSEDSGQGDQEFKNEVLLLAKLEHKNLVRLLGFCLHGQEKLLIYELMNASLDQFIFGIARGLLYLHEDSRLKIIHRDLKTSNILLAPDMVPKIADFGMARLFVIDQTQANTNRIVGTYGYMAPEYAFQGQFSVKSDVFSFGVLVLEILSGKKNTAFYESVTGGAQDLLNYAWRHWQNGSALELLDTSFKENCSRSEVTRCIHIALLCVQHSIANRPSMTTVILMLNSNSVTLPIPTQPGYLVSDEAVGDQWSLNRASLTELSPR